MIRTIGAGVLAALSLLHADALQRPAPQPDANGDYRFRWVDADGTPHELVLVPAGKIKPVVDVAITPYFDGRYLYAYTIRNDAGARQRLHGCVLNVRMPTLTEATPFGWRSGTPTNVVPRVGLWILRLRPDGTNDGIPEGQSESGFQLSSPNLPGVTDAQCLSDQDPTPVDEASLPESVLEELDRLPPPSERDEARAPAITPQIPVADRPITELVTAVSMTYGGPFATSAHPNGRLIVAELQKAAAAAERKDRNGVLAAYLRLKELLEASVSDHWARELDKGLTVCVAHILLSLETAR